VPAVPSPYPRRARLCGGPLRHRVRPRALATGRARRPARRIRGCGRAGGGPRHASARPAPPGGRGGLRVGQVRPGRCPSRVRYEVTLDARRIRVEITPEGRFTVDDRAIAADIRETVRGRQWSVAIEGSGHEVTILTHEPMRVDVDGREVRVSVIDERSLRPRGSAAARGRGRLELRAPMPGLLKAV